MNKGAWILLILLVIDSVTGQRDSVTAAFGTTAGLLGIRNTNEASVYIYSNCSDGAQGLFYCYSTGWTDYSDQGFGSSVAISPDGRWGFVMGVDFITVLDLGMYGHRIAWTLVYNAPSSQDNNNNAYYQLQAAIPSNFVQNFTDPCSAEGWLCHPGGGTTLTVGPPTPTIGQDVVGVLRAGCDYGTAAHTSQPPIRLHCDYAIGTDGSLTPTAPSAPLFQVSQTYLRVFGVATYGNVTAVLVCTGPGTTCQHTELFVYPCASHGVKLSGCLMAPSLAIDEANIVVGCPSQKRVFIFDLWGKLQATIQSEYSSFGSTVSVAKGLLTVGAADQAVLYDLGNGANSQPTTELVLPNFLSPTTMPVSFFSSAIPSPKHAVIVPSSFAPHTGFNTKLAAFKVCRPGEAYNFAFHRCLSCKPGMNKTKSGFGLCTLCPEGTYADSTQSATCTPCDISDPSTQTCAAGALAPYTFDPRRIQQSTYSPNYKPAIHLDMETTFYILCWPIFVWSAMAVLVLGGLLLVGSIILGKNRAWLFLVACMHKLNLFYNDEHHANGHGHGHGHGQGHHDHRPCHHCKLQRRSRGPTPRSLSVTEDLDSLQMSFIHEEGEGVVFTHLRRMNQDEVTNEDALHLLENPDDEEEEKEHEGREQEEEEDTYPLEVLGRSWFTMHGFLRWIGFLVSMFFLSVVCLFLVFSLTFLTFAMNEEELVYKTVPNDHSLNDDWLNSPIIQLNVTFVGFSPDGCHLSILNASSSTLTFQRPPQIEQIITVAGPPSCRLIVDIFKQPLGPAAKSIGISYTPGDFNPVPFYAQAIEYSMELFYNSTQAPLPLTPEDSGQGWSRVSGTIMPPVPGTILQGLIEVDLTGTFRTVQKCELPKKSPKEAFTTLFSTDDLKLRCTEATEDSCKAYSIMQVKVPVINASDYWAVNTSFSMVFSLQDGSFNAYVMQLESTSFGEVITVVLLTMMGIYHLFHFFFAPFEKLVAYVVKQSKNPLPKFVKRTFSKY